MPYNLRRRELLQDLGLLSAGITLAPAGFKGPVQEILASRETGAPIARPAWVKTVDKPTTEVDWDKVQRWDERNTAFNFARYFDPDNVKKLQAMQAANLGKWATENKPGYTLKDQALCDASNVRAFANVSGAEFPFLGLRSVKTPEQRGAPKFTATPEEAARVVSAAARFFGVGSIGFVELDPKTTQKLVFAYDGDGKKIEFADVDVGQETKEARIIPNKARWVIVFTVQMSEETQKRAPTSLGAATTYFGYESGGLIQTRLQEFLRALGYQGLGEYSRNALAIAPAFGVMGGLGELSRHNRLITPEFGPTVRVFKMITDLPLAPTRPIDAGIIEFCKRCKLCAEACPSKAISFDDEPSWQVRGDYNNPGHKAWFDDAVKCRAYWFEAGTGCAACYAACPYSNKDKALVHRITQAILANTPAAGGLMKTLHDLTYGVGDGTGKPLKDPEAWWALDLPEFGIDTARGRKNG